MKKSPKTIEDLTGRISYYHVLLLMASLPFDRYFSHVIVISYALHLLIQFKKPVLSMHVLIPASVFFITVISTLYTTNLSGALNEFTLHIPLLVFPLLFCADAGVIKKYRDKLLWGFSWVCAATIIYLNLDAVRLILYYKLPYTALFSAAFTNHNFSAPIDMHATFFSLQIGVALVYVLSNLINRKLNRVWNIICLLILSAGLVQLCSKSVFLALLLIINLAVPYFLLQKNYRLRFWVFSASVSAALLIIILSVNVLRTRYITDLRIDLSSSSKGSLLDSRAARWQVVTDVIKRAPFVGHGAGTETALLHEEFFKKKYYNSFLNNLNAHNQYLSFLFKTGTWGLLVYLATLLFGFFSAVKRKDLLLFTFMVLVGIVSLSENLLDVDKGVFFYAFFFSLFLFSASKKRMEKISLHSDII